MKHLTVAIVSSHRLFCDVEANFTHFSAITRRLSNRDARLICFPELALTSYTTNPAVLDVAESVPGPITEKLCALATLHNVYVSVRHGRVVRWSILYREQCRRGHIF